MVTQREEGCNKVANGAEIRNGRIEDSKPRGHRLNGRMERFKWYLRGYIFTQRPVQIGNGLPKEAIDADTIATFNRHLASKGLEGYGLNLGKWISQLGHHGQGRLKGPFSCGITLRLSISLNHVLKILEVGFKLKSYGYSCWVRQELLGRGKGCCTGQFPGKGDRGYGEGGGATDDHDVFFAHWLTPLSWQGCLAAALPFRLSIHH